MHDCFMRPGPPNFFMSLQKWHSPHSVRRHASHFLQRVLLRLAPDELRLDGSLTGAGVAAAGPILGFGRLAARCWKANSASVTQSRLSVSGGLQMYTWKQQTLHSLFFYIWLYSLSEVHSQIRSKNWKCNTLVIAWHKRSVQLKTW